MTRPHFSYQIDEDIREVIDHLGGDVNLLRNKTILITGGTGFFGQWLLQILCRLNTQEKFGIELYVVSRNPEKFLLENINSSLAKCIHFIKGDIRDFEMPNIEIDYLIHMATTAASETFNGEDQLSKISLLFDGTQNTLKNAIKCKVKKVLFTSSGVAYGPSINGRDFSEDDLSAPATTNLTSALGEGKRLAEYLIAYYAQKGGYQYAIARCFSFYGPFLPLNIHYALGNFINDALNSPKITINGSGQEMRSYLYIADAWVWLFKALLHADDEIYNVGSSDAISILQAATLVRDIICPAKGIEVLGRDATEGNFSRNRYIPNTDKICNKFNLSPWTSINKGILRMAGQ